jgi:hypothetical protein
MYRQFGNSAYQSELAGSAQDHFTFAKSGQLDALVALERIGTRLSFSRNDEIYAEGDDADYRRRRGPAAMTSPTSIPAV